MTARRGRYVKALSLSVGLLAAALHAGCAGFDSREARQTQLSVDVWSGFRQRPAVSGGEPERVEIVLDVTTSMAASAPGRPPRHAAARTAALRLATALPPETPLGVRALGITKGDDDCGDALSLRRDARAADSSALASLLATMRPASESSLADALLAMAAELGDDLQGTRVVVFSDLGSECGGDLCAAADALVGGGARLDLVLLADVTVPQCFAGLSPAGPPRAAELDAQPTPPPYRVQADATGSEEGGEVIARGSSDGSRLTLRPGSATIVLEATPPAVIGPLVLEAGKHTRVQVLDFPTLEPPTREWSWDSESGAPLD